MESKRHLDDLLKLFPKDELTKLKITPVGNKFELELNGLIMNCKDSRDLKLKFGHLVDLKEKFQKIFPPKKKESTKK